MKSESDKGTPIRVSWSIGDGYGQPWNEICAQVLEKFGLPGDKYTTEVSNSSMTFWFKEPEDALICRLTIGDNGGCNPS